MITISEVVEELIKKSTLLEEGMMRGIINYSSLARLMKGDIEKKVYKSIQTGAIIMALKRYAAKIKRVRKKTWVFKQMPDMIVRSNLMEITYANSDSFIKKRDHFFEKMRNEQKYFLIITQGVFETTLIVSKDLQPSIEKSFKDEKHVASFDRLSSITIRLPVETVDTPGVYGHILKTLEWEGINVVEVASTYTEFTIILNDYEIDRAFSSLKKVLTPLP
ncbi:hypothetical protein A2334_01455 [Candidatus Roizmanbacteria bacterium RIFOXYB2_FULL_38_10]|uniref:Aspartate kinase n=1 Tax=Candidatus Roizmanbacteria bacterium RIFOXYD1_FULL_38_12 TaxID=1802093 RepID=A0A1F7L233_9BACT|nr:MAG: hypothetical protein A3K47_05605 [Candidatus Roizmanbacteria bacterium RIFOXYA2_FULL_38_14]OGK64219.1 MAG: hypothetical protein A3K27_05605 [Candidatus Roizmanbacteria bacterium RIFOXYA1_FULL_37_12]OGK66065.1 MAG: hypothetical protein A3K38_05605 [Candidatus Roizmanbacteria bacterium RIFOXYB1_FULL_40_23]OGK68516.1 MAG: hypothetical protein A2334_01455 [Candidatus Roizmanbacteria bacterium RIFOXYB2_FULL_38_10]OGK70470.1 MAG: hypothetical protein A3K21_05610 [Candidatus Roizmanbacteria ba